jgi:hypothetical protein
MSKRVFECVSRRVFECVSAMVGRVTCLVVVDVVLGRGNNSLALYALHHGSNHHSCQVWIFSTYVPDQHGVSCVCMHAHVRLILFMSMQQPAERTGQTLG